MKRDISNLSPNELMVMEVFWNSSEPLTSVDIAKEISEWKSAYLNNLLASLQKKGMLKMTGVVLCGKHYIRQFVSVYSKEEYAVNVVSALNLEKRLIPKFVMAIAENVSDGSNESIISELENILDEFKNSEG